MKNESLVSQCDLLIQQIACLGPCTINGCGKQAECGHHNFGRDQMYYRHMIENIVPLCLAHHTGSCLSPHGQPGNYAVHMKIYAPEYEIWRREMNGEEITLARMNKKRPVPDRVDLRVTLERLREFYADGKPWTWDARILQETDE